MNRAALSWSFAVLGACFGDAAVAVNSLVSSNNGIGGGTTIGIAVNAVSNGRACGMIGGVAVGQDPAGACPGTNTNGAIPPGRLVSVTDAAGNQVDAESDIAAVVLGFKSYIVSAHSKSVTLKTFAQAEFVDPLTFSDPFNRSFGVDLTRYFAESDSAPGLRIGGDAGSGGTASASFRADMSSNLTGFLFSLDLSFTLNQPLNVQLTLGNFVAGLPGWDQAALTSQLRSALDADTADNDFSLGSYEFPNIHIEVAAGDTLVVSTDDIRTAVAEVPEPSIVLLLGGGMCALVALRRRRRQAV
jgi:hypothetical protein